jgi:hypothetical protein
MATPSTQSTGGSPAGRGVPKSWKKPRANDTIAAIDSNTYARQVRKSHVSGHAGNKSCTYENFVLESQPHELQE